VRAKNLIEVEEVYQNSKGINLRGYRKLSVEKLLSEIGEEVSQVGKAVKESRGEILFSSRGFYKKERTVKIL
jgi:hypothetical protein